LQEGYLDIVRQLKYWSAQFILAIPVSPFLRVILSLYLPNFSSLSFLFSLSPYLPISPSGFLFPYLFIPVSPRHPISASLLFSPFRTIHQVQKIFAQLLTTPVDFN
jgi:hypothetical protein